VGAKPCERPSFVEAEVDGDGLSDRVSFTYLAPRGAVLTVCTAAGAVAELKAPGMGEWLAVADVEPDGRAEMFPGGTTAFSLLMDVMVFLDDGLHYVELADGQPLQLASRRDLRSEQLGPGKSVGCLDADGDGVRELLDLSYWEEGDSVRWNRVAYRLEGVWALEVRVDQGTFKLPEDQEAIEILRSPTCGQEGLQDLRG
jgi:hypothetical protein